MKTEKHIRSWSEFEKEVEKLMHSTKHRSKKPFLFRGQSNTDWPLKTTMERRMGEKVEMWKYHLLIEGVKNRIEEFTGKTFVLPKFEEIATWLTKSEPIFLDFPGYEYMVYLRHHGFPSPLLDWSMSPFVAAYFAFSDVPEHVESVAIFAYLELRDGKSLSDMAPYIARLEPNIRSDRRHFLQQSTYTMCVAGKGGLQYYYDHEEVLAKKDQSHDLLWKFILPSTERENALEKLDMYNINAFSLFQSEDSLMETAFLRGHILHRDF